MERSLTHIALMAALVAILGIIPNVTLSFGVPISAQSLGIMLCGAVLGAKRGALAVLLFLALAAAGLPVLTGMRGGLGSFTGPSFGFLLGYPFVAFVIGWLVERTTLPLGFAATAASVIGGIAVLYAFGIPAMAWKLDKTWAEATYLCAAFLPGDLIKAVLAGAITASLAKMRPGLVMARA